MFVLFLQLSSIFVRQNERQIEKKKSFKKFNIFSFKFFKNNSNFEVKH